MHLNLFLLLVVIGPLGPFLFAEGQEFGGYVKIHACVVCACAMKLSPTTYSDKFPYHVPFYIYYAGAACAQDRSPIG